MTELGTYSFLPWLRQGLANHLQAPLAGEIRAAIPVDVAVTAEGIAAPVAISKTVPLYGPGEITGLKDRARVKTEPRPLVTNFESNYLPYIEFRDEDFPWRYTPAPPAGHQLSPWIALAVLKEDEFTDGAPPSRDAQASIVVPDIETVFPPHDQTWAWAHVHVDADLAAHPAQITSTDMDAVIAKLAPLLRANPDAARSRLLCPRRLDASTTYHAFVVPAFETGRLAALGLDPSTAASATHGAWAPDASRERPGEMPYYLRWMFQTGTTGDFEYLVRLLEPRPLDGRVGRRDVDLKEPGFGLAALNDPLLDGVLRLGGALRVPVSSLPVEEAARQQEYENWDRNGYPVAFQRDLADFVNLAVDYQEQTPEEAHTVTRFDATMPDPDHPGERIPDPDPLITPPLYGRWHSLTPRLLAGDSPPLNDNWVHQLNLDPRHRVAAGFGTDVIQRNQDTYLEAAWSQIGEVLSANRRIQQAQLAALVSGTWYDRTVVPGHVASAEATFAFTRPIQARVQSGATTVRHQVRRSRVPLAITSAPARRILRARGPLLRSLPFTTEHPAGDLINRINEGEVSAAPPLPPLTGSPVLSNLADDVIGARRPDWINPGFWRWLIRLLRRLPSLPGAVLALGAVLLLAVVAAVVAVTGGGGAALLLAVLLAVLAIGVITAGLELRSWQADLTAAGGLDPAEQTPGGLRDLPDGAYKDALEEVYILVQEDLDGSALDAKQERDTPKLALPEVISATVEGIDPAVTVLRVLEDEVVIPPWIQQQRPATASRLAEVMAYPEIDQPMYEPLKLASPDGFLPGIGLIPENTISLLETNQPFIEAYMAGVNHEFARELLWQGYPTDQRGTVFRQFWDVTGYLDGPGEDPSTRRERLRDIPPIHQWAPESRLGSHDHRERPGENDQEVVLVIRGELLKKYPTAEIYAHRATWQRRADGSIDRSQERRLREPDAVPGPLTRDTVKTPLYEAKIDPDIYFLGFDLTIPQARGGTGENADDDAGWFFVIKERSGEPRFGLDLGTSDELHTWNDLGWGNVDPALQPGDHLKVSAATPEIPLIPVPPGDEQAEQAADDANVHWDGTLDASSLAYILQQVPVLVAVHAAEMLPDLAPTN
jgi:hypothetical protein